MTQRSTARVNVKKGTFQSVCEDRKTLLVRLDNLIFIRLSVDATIKVCSGDRACTCRIVDIRRYKTIEDILKHEDLEKIAHGSHLQARLYLEDIYYTVPSEKELVVLELELTKIGRNKFLRD